VAWALKSKPTRAAICSQAKVALDRPWPSRFAYYVVARREKLERPPVRAFIDWLGSLLVARG